MMVPMVGLYRSGRPDGGSCIFARSGQTLGRLSFVGDTALLAMLLAFEAAAFTAGLR